MIKEQKLPVVFCIDTSRSMDLIIEGKEYCERVPNKIIQDDGGTYEELVPKPGKEKYVKTWLDKVAESIEQFYEAIKEDDMAGDLCDIAIVTFNENPTLLEDFASIDYKKMPDLPAPVGKTNLPKALDFCLDLIQDRKKEYRGGYLAPWIVILSDGNSAGKKKEVKDKLVKLQKDERLVVFTVALSDEESVVKSLDGFSINPLIKVTNANEISKFFVFLTGSVGKKIDNNNFNYDDFINSFFES